MCYIALFTGIFASKIRYTRPSLPTTVPIRGQFSKKISFWGQLLEIFPWQKNQEGMVFSPEKV